MGTFSSLLPPASLHCCGLLVTSLGLCASSVPRLSEALSWFSDLIQKVHKFVNPVDLVKRFQMNKTLIHTSTYLAAKIGFDTAENGPLKVYKKIAKRSKKL